VTSVTDSMHLSCWITGAVAAVTVVLLSLTRCIAETKPWSENSCDEMYHFHFYRCNNNNMNVTMQKCHNDQLNERFRLHPCSTSITNNSNTSNLFVSLPCNPNDHASCFNQIPSIIRLNNNISKVFFSEMGDGWLPSKIYHSGSSIAAYNSLFNSNSTLFLHAFPVLFYVYVYVSL
jgi:hypothetical protein